MARAQRRSGDELARSLLALEAADASLRWAAAYYLARVTVTAQHELADHAAKLLRLLVDRVRPPGAPDTIAVQARLALGAALAVTKRRADFVAAAREVDRDLAVPARKVFRRELIALFPEGRAAIPRAPSTRRKDRPDLVALVEAILAAPEDDAPRLVWADALLEAGDVRGEHVILQCERARTGKPPGARELALERANGHAWAGPSAAWLAPASLRYERGLLVAGAHGGRGATIAPEAASDPVWASVEELDVAKGSDVVPFLSGPMLRSLRKVTGLLAQDLVRITGRDLHHVGLRRVDVPPSRVVSALAKYRHLETLELVSPEPELMMLAAARLPQLKKIAFGRRRYERAGEGWRPARRG